MPSATREIRRRIRSVGNTRKVTKAMELVASAKMRRAVQAVLASRAYAARAWELVTSLAERTERELHPLLRTSTGVRLAVVVIASNRGLVGGFNSQLLSAVVNHIPQGDGHGEGSVGAVLFGKKGRSLVSQYGFTGLAEFDKGDVVTRVEEVRPLARLVINDFISRKFDRVILAYTDFISTLNQKPRIRQLLPLERDHELGTINAEKSSNSSKPSRSPSEVDYVFEPHADVVLEALLPRIVEMQLYQAVAESNASEHAARMVAMRNASDAAQDLLDDLTLSFNQARQAGITQDLAEISASRAVLES